MNVLELFRPQKRKNNGFDEDGRHTAYWVRSSGSWKEMEIDIYHCTSIFQLQKCRWYWAARVEEELWPHYWIAEATKKFDDAIDALAAQQAE